MNRAEAKLAFKKKKLQDLRHAATKVCQAT